MATKERKIRKSERPVDLHTVVVEDTEKAGAWLGPGGPLGRILVAGVISLVVAMGIGRFAFTPILPFMQARFGLSNAAIGALASSNYLGYLGGALLAAFVPPGRARDSLLRASLWTVAASTILMGLTADFRAWFALRFVAGMAGAGVFVLGSATVLEEVSRRGRPGLSGVLYSGPGIGIALSGLAVLVLKGLLGGEDRGVAGRMAGPRDPGTRPRVPLSGVVAVWKGCPQKPRQPWG